MTSVGTVLVTMVLIVSFAIEKVEVLVAATRF